MIADTFQGTYSVSVDANSLPDRFEFTTDEEATIVMGTQTLVSFGGFIREREVIITFQPPTADFFFEPEEPVVGVPISFDGTHSFDFDGIIVSYAWDFDGDGIVDSTDSIVQHTFQKSGAFDVALTVADDTGNEDTIIHPVTVSGEARIDSSTSFQPPVADFSYMPAQPHTGETVLFNGTASSDFDGIIMTYAWDFDGDGGVDATESIGSHVFPAPGRYSISLTVTDDSGHSDTVTYSIVIIGEAQGPAGPPASEQIPIAGFLISPAKPEPGNAIIFNGTSSLDLDGLIESFAWDFDDDGITDSSAPIAEYVFAAAGFYDVTLIVTDDDGNSDSVTEAIEVALQPSTPTGTIPPIADFAYLPTEPEAGTIILFNATLSEDPDGQIAAYAWDFDEDGEIDSTAAIVDHFFQEDGVYDVSLTVTDVSGSTDTHTRQIAVGSGEAQEHPATSLPPVADFEYSPAEPVEGELVLFNGLLSTDSDGEIIAYAWDFNGDDVIDSTDSFTQYVFLNSGTFNVSLTVTDDSGDSDSFIEAILVDLDSTPPASPPPSFQLPVADFSYMPAQPVAGELVLFNGTFSWDFDGEIVAYSWDFDNDGSSDASTPVAEHIFPSPGTITVSLTVTDDSGASDTLSIPIELE